MFLITRYPLRRTKTVENISSTASHLRPPYLVRVVGFIRVVGRIPKRFSPPLPLTSLASYGIFANFLPPFAAFLMGFLPTFCPSNDLFNRHFDPLNTSFPPFSGNSRTPPFPPPRASVITSSPQPDKLFLSLLCHYIRQHNQNLLYPGELLISPPTKHHPPASRTFVENVFSPQFL